MNRSRTKVFITLVAILHSGLILAAQELPDNELLGKALLNKELTAWEVWTGPPTPGVKLPKGYSRGDDPKNVPPIGLGDPLSLFSTQQDTDGNWVLHVSGKSRGALTTKAEYSDYHLSLLFKWGQQVEVIKRDSGVLYHAVGRHGAMWDHWKRSVELQLKEGGIGDLYLLGEFEVDASLDKDDKWEPSQHKRTVGGKTVTKIAAGTNNESPFGEWNRIDIYVLGDTALHVINGQPVAAIAQIKLDGEKVSAGSIQIQSSSSPCYFKDIRIRKITKLPKLKAFGSGKG